MAKINTAGAYVANFELLTSERSFHEYRLFTRLLASIH